MAKTLKATCSERCIGCELCVYEIQQQIKKAGLEGSLIRVFRNKSKNGKTLEFSIEIDPRIKNLNIARIRDICPQKVFELTEQTNELAG